MSELPPPSEREQQRQKRNARVLLAIVALLTLNYLVRFIPWTLFDYPPVQRALRHKASQDQIDLIAAWFEFGLTQILLSGLTLALMLIVVLREVFRRAFRRRGSERISVTMLLGVPLLAISILWFSMALLNPEMLEGTRAASMPYHFNTFAIYFMNCLLLCYALGLLLDPASDARAARAYRM